MIYKKRDWYYIEGIKKKFKTYEEAEAYGKKPVVVEEEVIEEYTDDLADQE